MGTCYLHQERDIERVCTRCNSGICSQCVHVFKNEPHCPHCVIQAKQNQLMFQQTLTWGAIVGGVMLLSLGWAGFKSLTTPTKKASVTDAGPADAGTPAKSASGQQKLLPFDSLLRPQPPGPQLTPAQKKALDEAKQGCEEKKSKKACREWATALIKTSSPSRFAMAQSALKQACALKSAEGCAELAQMHHIGMGVPRNLSRAAELYQTSCKLSYAGACTNLGIFFLKGTGVSEDRERARSLFSKACRKSSRVGCRNLGVVMLKGYGGKQNIRASVRAFRKGCKLKDNASCYNLGTMYKKGMGVRRSNKRAKRYLKQACQLGLNAACQDS